MLDGTRHLPSRVRLRHGVRILTYNVHSCIGLDGRLSPERIARVTASAGTRNLLSFSWCQELAAKVSEHPDIAKLLRKDAVAVLCTYFEKSAEMNWLVPAHQDLSIPVASHIDAPQCSGLGREGGHLICTATRRNPHQSCRGSRAH